MKAAFFSDRGIIKVTGENLASDTARAFLNGLSGEGWTRLIGDRFD